jgi:large subunit ribosomal protein L21
MSLAVIKTGGKQYVVKTGTKLKVEKLVAKDGAKVALETLLIADEAGEKVEIGKPFLSAKIDAKVLKQGRADKILVVKYKPKTRYRKRVGHRQPFTEIQIEKV